MKKMITRVTGCKIKQSLTGSYNFAWLLVGYSFIPCGTSLIHILLRYPIKNDTDLDKNAGVLFERCYFLLPF